MFTIWVVFHVIICVALVLVVLMQSSKGEGLAGSAFGGGGGGGGMAGAVFGGRGAASFLSNATSVLAVVFMLNCIALAYMSAGTKIGAGVVNSDGTTSSVVTEKAQQDRERALQQQQQQQQQVSDSTLNINVIPNEAAPDSN